MPLVYGEERSAPRDTRKLSDTSTLITQWGRTCLRLCLPWRAARSRPGGFCNGAGLSVCMPSNATAQLYTFPNIFVLWPSEECRICLVLHNFLQIRKGFSDSKTAWKPEGGIGVWSYKEPLHCLLVSIRVWQNLYEAEWSLSKSSNASPGKG